jgi:hypothetical protein
MKRTILFVLLAGASLLAGISCCYIVELTRFQTLAVVQETANSSSYIIVRDRVLHMTYQIERDRYPRKIQGL